MIWVDYGILIVFLVSVLIGLFRGFTRELLGLLSWVAAFWIAWAFAGDLSAVLASRISDGSLRMAVCYAVLFFGSLLVGAIATSLLVEAARNSRFSPADRMLGAALGGLRAALLAGLFILLAGMTDARNDRWWKESVLVSRMEWIADALKSVIPQGWLEKLKPQAAAAGGTPSQFT